VKPDDPAGYVTLFHMLRDSLARDWVLEEELQGIIAKYCDRRERIDFKDFFLKSC
jgi:hypothetical protein